MCNMIKILKIQKYDKVQYDKDFPEYDKIQSGQPGARYPSYSGFFLFVKNKEIRNDCQQKSRVSHKLIRI